MLGSLLAISFILSITQAKALTVPTGSNMGTLPWQIEDQVSGNSVQSDTSYVYGVGLVNSGTIGTIEANISNNIAHSINQHANGAGIDNLGKITNIYGDISGNTAEGGAWAYGGGISNNGWNASIKHIYGDIKDNKAIAHNNNANGGRNGVSLTAGLRFKIGKEHNHDTKAKVEKENKKIVQKKGNTKIQKKNTEKITNSKKENKVSVPNFRIFGWNLSANN